MKDTDLKQETRRERAERYIATESISRGEWTLLVRELLDLEKDAERYRRICSLSTEEWCALGSLADEAIDGFVDRLIDGTVTIEVWKAVFSTSEAISEIIDERRRQINDEEWTLEHDDEHIDESLAAAAACYAQPEKDRKLVQREDGIAGTPLRGETPVYTVIKTLVPNIWPESWAGWYWKPKDRRRDLVRAAALIVAEIERLDRIKK